MRDRFFKVRSTMTNYDSGSFSAHFNTFKELMKDIARLEGVCVGFNDLYDQTEIAMAWDSSGELHNSYNNLIINKSKINRYDHLTIRGKIYTKYIGWGYWKLEDYFNTIEAIGKNCVTKEEKELYQKFVEYNTTTKGFMYSSKSDTNNATLSDCERFLHEYGNLRRPRLLKEFNKKYKILTKEEYNSMIRVKRKLEDKKISMIRRNSKIWWKNYKNKQKESNNAR